VEIVRRDVALHVQRTRMIGFTLVELIMTMVIIGIIAVVAVPRFSDNNVFQSRGFADQVLASLRYAQKVAIARHSNVCANYSTSPNRLTLMMTVTTSCDTALSFSSGNSYIEAPSGVTFSMSAASIIFDALGRPTPPATATVGTTAIIVEAETGYVHSP